METPDRTTHTNATSLKQAKTQPTGLRAQSWYQQGRDYASTMNLADAKAQAGAHEEARTLLTNADRQLWPLDRADGEALRDFIAGINRETEARVIDALSGTTTRIQAHTEASHAR